MYTTTPLQQLLRTDVAVVADTSMAHVLSLLAKVLAARNPQITAPPDGSVIWESAGDPNAAARLAQTLEAAVNDPFFLRVKVEPPATAPLRTGTYADWLIATANLGLSGLLAFPRKYIKDVPAVRDSLAVLQDDTKHHLGAVLGGGIDTLMERDEIRVPFARLALTMSYGQILRSGLFDKIPTPDSTTEKGAYTTIERGLLLRVLMQTLAIQTLLLRVRPVLRFLRMDQSRARLREELMPSQVEYWEQIIDRVLAMPVHPWIARAEETALPTNRITPWGDATPTILLERSFIASPWDGVGDPSIEERTAYAQEVAKRLDPPALLEAVTGLLRDLRRLMDDLEVGGRFAKIASVLSFTKPGAPVPIPLWSQAFKVYHLDGLHATESISDLIALSFQLHLPAQGPVESPWIGEDSWANYTGAERANSKPSVWNTYVGSVSIAPEDVIADSAWHTSRFTPRMFAFKTDSYKGDMGAVFFNATPEGVAAVLGKSLPELTTVVAKSPADWNHIFEVVQASDGTASGIKARRPKELLFYSDRTRLPWLTTIDLPRKGVPTLMWAMRRGRPDTALPVRARFLRDPIVPLPSVPLASAISGLERTATPGDTANVVR